MCCIYRSKTDAVETIVHVFVFVQLRGQRRNITSWRSFDAEPKSGKAEESATLQNLTDEVKMSHCTNQTSFILRYRYATSNHSGETILSIYC